MAWLQGYDATFKRMIAVDMGFWISVYLFLPVLPLFYRAQGMADASIGLAVGGYALGALAARLPTGRIIDRVGCLPVINGGLLCCILAVAAYPYAVDPLSATAVRVLHGAGGAAYSTAAITWVTLQYGGGRLKESIALYTFCIMVGVGIATAGGGWLQQSAGFAGVVAVSLAGAVLALCGFPRSGGRPAPRCGIRPSLWRVFCEPLVWLPTVNQFVVYACYGTLTTFLPLQLAQTAGTAAALWPFYFAYTAAVLLSRLLAPQVGRKLGNQAAIWLLLLGGSACLLPLALQGTPLLCLAGIGAGSAVGFATPILTGIVALNTAPEVRGTALSLFGIAMDLGLGLGTVAMGLVAAQAGYAGVFLAMAAICGAVLLLNFAKLRSKTTTAVMK